MTDAAASDAPDRTMTPDDWSQIKHFTAGEFRNPEKMSYEFMLWLDKLREESGVPMTITSSYRSPKHNREVGGAQDSAHTDVPCRAADVGERPRADDPNWTRTRFALVSMAIRLGCKRIGLYANGSLHFDLSADRPQERMWRQVGALGR